MVGLTLPESLTPDNVRTIALAVAIAAVVLAVVVLRIVQKLVMKLTLTVLLVGVGALAWHERGDLADCAKSCECKILGIDVRIPADDLPADPTIVCGDRAG